MHYNLAFKPERKEMKKIENPLELLIAIALISYMSFIVWGAAMAYVYAING